MVATNNPPMMEKAIGPQNTVGAIGIRPRTVDTAVSMIGRCELRFAGKPDVLVALVDRVRRTALVVTSRIMRLDGTLQQWPAAVLALLALAVLFGIAMSAGR